MSSVLTTCNLSFSYGEHQVLNDFNMSLNSGEFVALIGANGAGKSTIVQLLSGYLPMSSGDVFLDGQPIQKLSHRQRSELLAVLSQKNTVDLPYTVEEVVLMGRISRHSIFSVFAKEDYKVAEEVLSDMDVLHLRKRKFTTLSGGEQQRVLIAATLAQQPKILILDEPTSALDLGHSIKLMTTLKALQQKGITILIISHDLQLMAEWCNRLILLKDGKIIAEGTTKDVMQEEFIRKAYDCNISVIYDENRDFLTLRHK